MKKLVPLFLIICCLAMTATLTACKHEHEVGEWEITLHPTCVAEGKREKICDCGESLEQEIIAINPNNHTSSWAVTKPATCTSSGLKNEECSGCGQILRADVVIPADPNVHQFDILTNSCVDCGKKELPEITSFSQPEADESKIVIMLDYVMSGAMGISIDSATEYVRFVGTPHKEYPLTIVIESRDTPITLDFVNATIRSADTVTIQAKSKALLNIGFYGERSAICGLIGASGKQYSTSSKGKDGKCAISVLGDIHLTIAATSCSIRGGNGGAGADGTTGADGGDGGNGAYAIYTEGSIKATCKEGYTRDNFSISGGSGGSGGAAGSWFFGTPKAGRSGASSAASNVEIYYLD